MSAPTLNPLTKSSPSTAPTAGGSTASGIFPTVQSYGAYIYWGVGILASVGIAYALYKMDYQIAGVLSFLGAILALLYYYVKWFRIPSSQTGSWPPYVTPCPDFLTLADPGTNGTAKCVDYVGVSTTGKLKVADPKKPQINDSRYYFPINKSTANTDLCQSAAQYGLTWSSICPE